MISIYLQYAFVDYNEKEQIIAGEEVVNRAGWQGATTYYRFDGVAYDGEDYIALAPNSNVIPGTDPTLWSILVEVDANASPAQSGVDPVARAIATAGSNLAWDIYTGTYFLRNEDDSVFCHHISWGTGTNNVNAAQIPYSSTQTVAEALDSLLYVAPVVTSFTNNINTVETGGSVSVVNLAWSYNKSVTSQSMDQGVGSLDPALRALTVSGAYTSSTTWNLTASDGTSSCNGNTTVSFMQKRYWGVSVNTSLNDAQIIALNSEFSSSRAQSRIITAAGEYIYFAYPASFGAASFTVNGLPNTAWTLVTRAFINTSGFSESYNIYRSNNLLTGTYTIVVS